MPAAGILSEAQSKRLLAAYGVPVVEDRLAGEPAGAIAAADALGYPVVLKLCGPRIAHKTERELVRLALRDAPAVRAAAEELLAAARPDDGLVDILVTPMLRATRELIAGLHADPQFGRCVMVGIGGVQAEVIGEVVFRLLPIEGIDAAEMIDELLARELLGAFRGEPPVDRGALADILLALSRLAESEPTVVSVDVNPLLVVQGKPIAVDALVEVSA